VVVDVPNENICGIGANTHEIALSRIGNPYESATLFAISHNFGYFIPQIKVGVRGQGGREGV
jgi:hypothetical protein